MNKKEVNFIIKFVGQAIKQSKGAKDLRIQAQYRLGIFGDEDSDPTIPELGPGWLFVADWGSTSRKLNEDGTIKKGHWKECSVYLEDEEFKDG